MKKAFMEKRKKDNKGFSLVELIVVVMIIAIISVSLAPQVMKWVGKSRDSVDENNAATIKSAVSTAVADYLSEGKPVNTDAVTFYIAGSEPTGVMGDMGCYAAKIKEVMGGEWPKPNADKQSFKVVIAANTGSVTVTLDSTPTT